MPRSAPDLLTLAEAIADGSQVDWDRAESSAVTEDEQRVVQQLRRLAGLGEAARSAVSTWGGLEIRGEVGGGTFGTVYRAWDRRLQREVALKLLHPEHSSHSFASSVVKEGQVLAQIRHPNVVTVHGADVFDGRVGIWMEFVTGRTLKEILQAQGPFGAHEAALVGRDLCRALAAVHQRGFLHRDIKAQNVMREAGGRTVLMDFGAGDALAAVAASPMAGSPAYLAPEVLAGAVPTVQADLYSLGVLLFHLASGEFPVAGRSLDEFRELHASGRRRLLRDLRPDLPAAFVRAVDRATAADPSARPESAGAMEALLDGTLTSGDMRGAAVEAESHRRRSQRINAWLIAASAVVMVAVVGIALGDRLPWRRAVATAPPLVRNSVAVLPFEDLSAESGNGYFGDGITQDVVAHLGAIRDLRVIAGASTRRFALQKSSAAEIGEALGVSAVLSGSVRLEGERVRVVSQLVDAQSGQQLWSESYDRDATDVFSIQSEVARKIAVALKGEISAAEANVLDASRGKDFESFNLYLKGRHQWSLRNEEGFNRSLGYFNAAIERDPRYALAYAGLADAYTLAGVSGYLPRQVAFERAKEAALTAVGLDGALAEAQASLGYAQKNQFDWPAAEASFRRAIQLKPGYAVAHHWYATLLTQVGRFSEAITEIKIALSLDPYSVSANGQFAAILMMSRRFDEAIVQINRTIEMEPQFRTSYQLAAEAYAFNGDLEQALKSAGAARQAGALGGEDQELLADIGYIHAKAGRKAEAMAVINGLLARFQRNEDRVAASIATVFAALGQRDDAFKWLETASASREAEIGYLGVDPRWDALRADPRFDRLLEKAGLGRNGASTLK